MVSNNISTDFDPQAGLPVAFTDLPGKVYAEDPFWPGEDTEALRQQFSTANPWFQEGTAWVGVEPGKVRLAGFFSHRIIDGEPAAFFGFWEGVEDLSVHQALFRELSEWAAAKGAKRLYGPINFTTFNAYRLRLDSFGEGCFPGEPWNPAYYPALMEKLGFDCRYRYLSTFSQTPDIVQSVAGDYLRVKPKLEQVVRMEAMTPEFWMDHLDEIFGFVDQVFGANFAYTPISRDAFQAHCGEAFAHRFCPFSSVLARSQDGPIAGFFLVFPDYGPLLCCNNPTAMAGKDIRYQSHFQLLPRPRRALAKTAGVHPDFRSLGLFTAMGCELSLRVASLYDELGAALVREDNNSRQFALRHGTASRRHYGLFQKALFNVTR